MDEPMSNLDPGTKAIIGKELKQIQDETGMTTIYVTHNQQEAMLLGNRISILNHGIIEQIDTPENIFYQPRTEFIANFMGINGRGDYGESGRVGQDKTFAMVAGS